MPLRCLRFSSAGESHGPMLIGLLDGLPAGLPLDLAAIDAELARRMKGYGRGKRMKIEADAARIVGGVRLGETLGSPVAWLIENRDWPNWQEVMSAGTIGSGGVAESGNSMSADEQIDRRRISRPRPGHADLAGGLKYDRGDLRDILERASARETASRVAAGAICRQLLAKFGVAITSHVRRIGSAALDDDRTLSFEDITAAVDASLVRCADSQLETAMIAAIDVATNTLETLGGTFEVVARGLLPGLGSHVQWDRKLEGRIAQAMLSIPAQKGVEIGRARWAAARPGSEVHDEIHVDEATPGGFRRSSNTAGGIEGGISNGEELRVTVDMKPLSTLRKPLASVDIDTREPIEAVVQRSDTCAVPAAALVGEAMLALTLADAYVEKFGGDSLREMQRNVDGYRTQLQGYPPQAR